MAAPIGIGLANGNVPDSAAVGGFVGIHSILRRLENGLLLKRFYSVKSSKRKPEKRMFKVKLETRELVWTRHTTSTRPEGSVDLREVREIRFGRSVKEFDKYPEEIGSHDAPLCMALMYGSEFRLKTLALAANSVEEFETWKEGLRFLVHDTQHASYSLQEERWLRKEFYNMDRGNNAVTLKDIKSWMTRINHKISNNRLREKYQEVDSSVRELNFERFSILYHNLLHADTIFEERFTSYLTPDTGNVSLAAFKNFLAQEQKEPLSNDVQQVKKHMQEYLDNTFMEASGDVYFTKIEFLDYLFSKHNTIFDEKYDNVVQSMDQPLTQYWIASSHNTKAIQQRLIEITFHTGEVNPVFTGAEVYDLYTMLCLNTRTQPGTI